MADDHGEIERTEAPSPRWVAQARERGVWPRSAELTVACSVLAGILFLRFASVPLIDSFREALRGSLDRQIVTTSAGRLEISAGADLIRPFLVAAPWLLVPAIVAAAAGVGQAGFRLQLENFTPRVARLNGAPQLARILSGRSAIDSLVMTVKWTTLLGLSAWWLYSDFPLRALAGNGEVEPIAEAACGTMLRVATKLAVALLLLGCIDYARAWWTHIQQMRLSRAELIADLREQDGDPTFRRRRRQRQMDLSLGNRDSTAKTGNQILPGKGCLDVAHQVASRPRATVIAKTVRDSRRARKSILQSARI